MLLARHIDISLNGRRLSFPAILRRLRFGSFDWFNTLLQKFALHAEGRVYVQGQSLLKLMVHFQEFKCSLIHDRVFSLLSLCDNAKVVSVCYDVSVDEVAYQVQLSIQADLCICSARTVAARLDIRSHITSYPSGGHIAFIEFYLDNYTLQWLEPNDPSYRYWTARNARCLTLKYGHHKYFRLSDSDANYGSSYEYRQEPSWCVDKWCARFCADIFRDPKAPGRLFLSNGSTQDSTSYKLSVLLARFNFPQCELGAIRPDSWRKISPGYKMQVLANENRTVRIPLDTTTEDHSIDDGLCGKAMPLHANGTLQVRVTHDSV
jgi:hypothetical protein